MVTMQAIVDTMNTFVEETILVVDEAVNVDVREKPMGKVINQEVAQEEIVGTACGDAPTSPSIEGIPVPEDTQGSAQVHQEEEEDPNMPELIQQQPDEDDSDEVESNDDDDNEQVHPRRSVHIARVILWPSRYTMATK